MRQEGIWPRRKLSIGGSELTLTLGLVGDIPAGVRPRPADVLEGSLLCRKESSSPDPESGEQWMPFSKVSLEPGGTKIQGA